jgi:uncharacterized protein YyaL (SSP411 family)
MANRLSTQKSPYLLQHKDNPVDWHPWDIEAFAKAKLLNKPVFLSIGYSTCHWCHVMAHESFENPQIASQMNEQFINIKVDREERPDVDRLYMAFVQATTGGGGWPMSVWLTPDGKPFFGGTYFPPEGRFGRAGFPSVLQQISDLWNADQERIENEGDRVIAALREASTQGEGAGKLDAVSMMSRATGQFADTYDANLGGFGGAPKFPRPSVLNYLFRSGITSRMGRSDHTMALQTLRKMAAGGIRDHLGGGFHRYSVDEFWHVPHFEKMLYDQAQLAVSYTEAWQITRIPYFETIAREILDYVKRDMTHPDGGFFSAEDADSLLAHGSPEHAEGAFYVWTQDEIMEILGEKTGKEFCLRYGVEPAGNSPAHSDPQGEFRGKNILIDREGTGAKTLAESRAKLLERRSARPKPHLDDKILTAWNGLMISAFAKAGAAFGDKSLIATAVKAAEFVKTHLTRDGRLLRSWREGASDIPGFAEDYAFLIQALLDLYSATFDTGWISWAVELQKIQDELFWDEAHDSYFGSAGGDPLVPVRMKDDYDGAEPSANAISALNLLRLSRMMHETDWEKRVRKILTSHALIMERAPTAVPQMLVALDLLAQTPKQVVICGERDESDTRALTAAAQASFLPHTAILLADEKGKAFFGGAMAAMSKVNGQAAAYVCENFTCRAPVTNPEELGTMLYQRRSR